MPFVRQPLAPDASFDEALEELHHTHPEFGGGLSNHGPMAAEALLELGLQERVVPFLNAYASRLEPLPAAAPLDGRSRASSLGALHTAPSWIATYLRELTVDDGDEAVAHSIVRREVPRLLRGIAATHGLLRTAHAVRSLRRVDSDARRRELAHGLGYWSSEYVELFGDPGEAAVAGRDVVTALAELSLLPEAQRVNEGLIIDRYRALDGFTPFAAEIGSVDIDALPWTQTVTELASFAARQFVAEGSDSIVILHAVTTSSALRLLEPWLDEEARRSALRYGFQLVAATHATHASAAGNPAAVNTSASREGLTVRAADHQDEHAIKLIEACLREHTIDARPEFLEAAERWADVFG